METLVSIVIPIYNVEKYLERCVDSILSQSYKNFEMVLVDDGSPDNCPKLCDEFAKTDSRIKVIHKENGGLSSARLAGFSVARGEYILFIDSDDYIEPDMVEKMVCAAQANNADMTICGYYTQYEAQKHQNLLPYNKAVLQTPTEIIDEYVSALIGCEKNKIDLPGFLCIRLLKTSLIKEDFFVPENHYFAEDVIFDLLYSDFIKKIAVVNIPLYHYCVNGQSLSNKYRKNKWQMLKNLYNFKCDFLSNRSISGCDARLSNCIVSSVFVAVDNAILSGSYPSFLNEIKFLHKDAKDIINSADKNPLHGTVSVTMLLLKLRLYFVIYHLRKSRLKK